MTEAKADIEIQLERPRVEELLGRADVRAVEDAFPNYGFHATLVRLAGDYGGSTLVGGVKVIRGIVKW
ncbi:MAG: hypothetical protein AAGF46_13185 [Pseudomonadota bacterium]